MRLPDSFLEELRARTNLAALVGRRARLTRSGRHWKACCPFHQEKTPSFYVYDDGYHCFGCGAHGDAIGFVMQSQGAGFMEAVEALAQEAGMEVPRPDARAAAAEQEKLDLREVLEAAATLYEAQLWSPAGAAALAYLRGRGLADETIRRFGLGWSGEGQALARLAPPERLGEAGLLREEAGASREFFFRRVMFPIRDRRSRVASFGGRVLGEGQPKYLNGPETALFSKRRTLYGLDLAREAARRGDPVVAVEGYLDVIALHQAGFAGAVAPLGTALGAEQLTALWELSPAPTLCFDGDAAGGRAAARAVEVALPLLSAERTLRFATLAEGEDPDSLVRRRGAGAFTAALESARPFSTALFEARRALAGHASPEQRARLRSLLAAAVETIPDRALRAEYQREFNDRMFAASRRHPPKPALPRAKPVPNAAGRQRGEILLAIALAHPGLLATVGEALGTLGLAAPWEGLRDATLAWAEHADVLDSPALANHLASLGLASEIDRLRAVLPAQATAERAEACWWHFYGLSNAGDLERQVTGAREAAARAPSEAAFRRLAALSAELWSLRRGEAGEAENLEE